LTTSITRAGSMTFRSSAHFCRAMASDGTSGVAVMQILRETPSNGFAQVWAREGMRTKTKS
jgi:hypothetical protein